MNHFRARPRAAGPVTHDAVINLNTGAISEAFDALERRINYSSSVEYHCGGHCRNMCDDKKEAQELLQKAGRSGFAPMLVDDPEGCLRLLVQLKSENPSIREIVFMDLALDPVRHVESYLLLSSALEEHNRRQG